MKLRILFLYVFVLLSLAIPCVGADATVMAWNLGGFTPIQDSKIPNYVRAIKEIDPDVIVLTEVNPNTVAKKIADGLDDYKFQLLTQTASQNIAILYKDDHCVLGTQLIANSDNGNASLRKALAAYVQIGNFDFILIGLHLKAGRGNAERTTRTSQANAISTFIKTMTAFKEKDVLVVGDYNMIPVQDAINFTTMSPGSGSQEFLHYISDPFAGQVSHIGSCPDGQARGNFLDGFAISGTQTSEYRANSLKMPTFADTNIFSKANGTAYTCDEYNRVVSDHFPLVAKFKTDGVDDD